MPHPPESPQGLLTEALDLLTEAQFAQVVIQAARGWGWLVGYTRDSRKSEPGEPDLRMIRPPRVVWAELKREKGRLSRGRWNKSGNRWLPGQDDWADLLRQCSGVEYYLLRPSDWERVVEILK